MLSAASAPPSRIGTSGATVSSTPSGSQDIVSAGANTTGLIVRSIWLLGATSYISVANGSDGLFFAVSSGAVAYYNGPGILIRPGTSLRYVGNAAGNSISITWDVL
jgi:hypothetical protein